MSLTIDQENALVTMDPNDRQVLIVDWDTRNLPAAVTITSSTFTITAVRPTTATGLTKDSEVTLAGNRKTQLRLLAGGDSAVGQLFLVANTIVTNESPAQTKERSFRVLIEQR